MIVPIFKIKETIRPRSLLHRKATPFLSLDLEKRRKMKVEASLVNKK